MRFCAAQGGRGDEETKDVLQSGNLLGDSWHDFMPVWAVSFFSLEERKGGSPEHCKIAPGEAPTPGLILEVIAVA